MTAFARQCLLFVATILAAGPATAAPQTPVELGRLPSLPTAGEAIVRHHATGIALNGFDPVAYFEKQRPVAGRAEHEFQHAGATWRFATRANRETFAASPDDYMPLFGGYDPVAVTTGRAVSGQPEHFALLHGRLVLFHSAIARNQAVSAPQILTQAKARWPDVENQLAR